jgi:2-C-methyl-D-erythritol 2,4-cyclodiphosphate synthase
MKTQQREVIRFGLGYDVHRLVKKRKLMLGGVHIPSDLGLLGHSDADALLHAVCDALLGAAALGDIGKHFPDTEKKYHNISSLTLLRRVGTMLHDHGWCVNNIDSTVVLEKPKIAAYVETMRLRMGKALKLPPQCISIKATTHEGLGTFGRQEGCAAFAIASILQLKKK